MPDFHSWKLSICISITSHLAFFTHVWKSSKSYIFLIFLISCWICLCFESADMKVCPFSRYFSSTSSVATTLLLTRCSNMVNSVQFLFCAPQLSNQKTTLFRSLIFNMYEWNDARSSSCLPLMPSCHKSAMSRFPDPSSANVSLKTESSR